MSPSTSQTDEVTPSSGLQANQLATLLDAIRHLGSGRRCDKLSDVDFLGLCRVYQPEQFAFEDYVRTTRATLDLLVAHKAELVTLLPRMRGSIDYMVASLEGQYDPNGFAFLACGIETAVRLELEILATALHDHPAAVAQIEAHVAFLRSIEGAQYRAYELIRRIGDRFIDEAEQLIHSFRPTAADFVLHAYDGFKGNAAVIAMYERALADMLPEHPLRAQVEIYLARVSG